MGLKNGSASSSVGSVGTVSVAESHPRGALLDFETGGARRVIDDLSAAQMSLHDLLMEARSLHSQNFEAASKAAEKEVIEEGVNRRAAEPLEELLTEFQTDTKLGLDAAQVESLRGLYGENKLAEIKREGWVSIFLRSLTSPVILLLLAAGIVCCVFQEWAEGSVVIAIVLLNSFLTTVMENSASKAMAALAQLAAPSCQVLRGGAAATIPSTEIVPGDVLILTTGATVAADARVFEAVDLRANEMILTGEPYDIRKSVTCHDPHAVFADNLLFGSTAIVEGHGKAIVIATGMQTQVGRIANHLVDQKRAKPTAKPRGPARKEQSKNGEASDLLNDNDDVPSLQTNFAGSNERSLSETSVRAEEPHGPDSSKTPLQAGLDRLGGWIGGGAILCLCIVVTVAILLDYEDPTHADVNHILSIVLVGVGFAVCCIPEGLPLVVTICLSRGCTELMQKNANVRKLPAVETLGSCSVICSDKTGTLTEGKMTATRLIIFAAGQGESRYRFYPTKGFDPVGGLFKESELTDDHRKQIEQLLENLVAGEDDAEMRMTKLTTTRPNFTSVLTERSDPSVLEGADPLARLAVMSLYLNSYTSALAWNKSTGTWTTTGNMSEGAIVVAAAKCRFGSPQLLPQCTDPQNDYPRIDMYELPFSSSRKCAATVHKLKKPNEFEFVRFDKKPSGDITHVCLLKGAPEILLEMTRTVLFFDPESRTYALRPHGTHHEEISAIKSLARAANEQLSDDALRVLAIGIIGLTDYDVLEAMPGVSNSIDDLFAYYKSRDFCLVAMLGSLDPPKVGVREAVEQCQQAGIKVVMITGDQTHTASAVARRISLVKSQGLEIDKTQVIECKYLHQNHNPQAGHLKAAEVDEITKKACVFARAQPDDKIVIVKSLQRQNHVVAMTGDGVNDAPALQHADIGIAMGITGTDVAKGASELVLLDDNFVTIVSAINIGRRIYSNIQIFVAYMIGCNTAEIVYLFTAIVLDLMMPIAAVQILFLNMLTSLPALSLSVEPANPENMKKPPRPRKERIMTREWWLFGNLPHAFIEAVLVILNLCFAMYINNGTITLDGLKHRCKKQDGHRYYCQNAEFRWVPWKYFGWVTNVDYYNPDAGRMWQVLGAVSGKHMALMTAADVLGPTAAATMAAKCTVDDQGWCYAPNANSDHVTVIMRGTDIALTMSFLTCVLVEIGRTYTVRSWMAGWRVFNRNMTMHLLCAACLAFTVLITLVHPLNTLLGLWPLQWWQYWVPVALTLLAALWDEVSGKLVYRRWFAKRPRRVRIPPAPVEPPVDPLDPEYEVIKIPMGSQARLSLKSHRRV